MNAPARLRIAHFSATFPPYYAGSGNACFYQARELAARGHDVTVHTAEFPGDPVDPPGVLVHRLKPKLRIGNAPLIPSLFRVSGFDVLHVYQPFIFGTDAAMFVHRRTGIPLVSSFQNELKADGLKGRAFGLYNATVTRAAVRSSAKLTVLSLDHARTVPTLARELAARPQAFHPTPNGVDVNAFTPGDGSQARASLGFSDKDVVAIFCAKLDSAHRFKRLDLVLRALTALRDVNLKLMVVGGGDLLEGFEDLTLSLGIADQVVFLGDRPHDSLIDLFRASDFLVLASDSVESFAIVQAEAMACGKPVLVTSLPGVREISRDGIDGFQATPGDLGDLEQKLRLMVEIGHDRRTAMGASGREHVVANFSWARSAERLEQAYLAAITDVHGPTAGLSHQ